MATLIQDPHQISHSHSWPTTNTNGNGFGIAAAPNPNQRFQYSAPAARSGVNGGSTAYESLPPLPAHNEVEMTREMLIKVLDYFSQLLPQQFDWSVIQGQPQSHTSGSTAAPPQGMRFVVHGGACMLLHPGLYTLSMQQQSASASLVARTKTRDVDYVHRGFIAEYGQMIPDAAERLKECIQETARRFNLGADWMNCDADIALPMAHDPKGKLYDPIYTASVSPQNIALHTIYQSSNGFLTLISVTPFWAVALKLVRYTKWDPGDICLLLRNGTLLSKTQWTPETLEGWLFTECWAMGYINWDARKKAEMRSRIEHAIRTLAEWNHYVGSGSSPPGKGSSGELGGPSRHSGERDRERERERGRGRTRNRDKDMNMDMEPPLSAHDVMGGGAVVGGQFASQHGWKYSFATPPGGSGQSQTSIGAFLPMAGATSNMPPGVLPSQLHVSQWGSPDVREKSKSRSKNASRAASRNHSLNEPQEIFIPPDLDSDSEDEGYGAYYDRGQVNTQNASTSWVHLNPNHAPPTIPPPQSHMTNPGPSNQTAVGPWPPATQTGGNRSDPYAMRNLDQAIGSILYGTAHSPPQDYVNRLPGFGAHASGNGFRPVIPVIPPDNQVQLRKKKEKQRKLERQRARGSKWRYASETESEESDGDYSDVDEHDKENRIRDLRERNQHEAFGKKIAQGGPWHQIYAPAIAGRSNSESQTQTDPSRQYMAYASGNEQYSSMLTAGRISRPGSRNPSPNNTKRRPPPLNLTPPPVIPRLPSHMQRPDAPVIPAPVFTDPARLAQYQFEQQQKDYQREREQQQLLAEREQAFYQRRQFKQVPSQQQQQQQQQHMYQHQQQQYQYQYQQQLQQMQHAYR